MIWLNIVANRLLWLVPTLLGLLAIVFVLSRVVPIDPAALAAGDNATPAQVAAVRHALGFDLPLPEQFVRYVGLVARGDFGTSLFTQQPIVDDLSARLPATLELTLVAIVLAGGIGVPLGVVCGLRRNSWVDHALRIVTVSGLAVASFWFAMQLQFLFSMKLAWLPLSGQIEGFPPEHVTGLMMLDALLTGDTEALRSAARHIVLPAITLALPAAATVVRFTRNGVIGAISSPSVAYQTAMGYPRRLIVWKYVLRLAITATVTQLGLIFGILLAGAVVVETVFDWPGIGAYAVRSILQSDYNAIMGFTLWVGAMFIAVNLLVDLLQAAIDPRGADGHTLMLRRFARDRAAMLGAVLIGLLVLAAIFAPWLAPHPEDVWQFHTPRRLLPPGPGQWFGTDRMGSDVFSRILFGARITLSLSVIAVGTAVLIGVPLGLVAGYFRGWFSDMLMRFAEIFLAVPQIVLAIAIAQTLGPSIQNVILALSITYWPFWARLVYAETRSLRNEVFIESAIALGASPLRVMVLHVLPSIASPIIVRTSIGMGATILTAATLGFLGLGAPPPTPEWGRMIAESREYLPDAWWYALAPGIAIFLTVLGFNLLGDGLRDILDPRTRRAVGPTDE